MNLILNEKEMVKKSLENGYIHKKPTITIKILIKHFFNIGMTRNQVRQSIEDFLKKNMEGFNPVKWDRILDNLVKQGEKNKSELREITSVNITKKELETLQGINDINLEKIAFTYLVYCKIYNQLNNTQSNWVNAKRKDIFNDAKISVGVHKQRLMVNDLITLGLIESSKRRNCSNKKVLFVDDNSDTEITITDFRNFVYEYLKWKGEKIKNCKSCDRLIKPTGKNQRMCRECWKEYRKEQNRENFKRWYNKQKNNSNHF